MQYRTIRAAASAEFVEKRSRFIGYISPVTTQQDAIAFIDSIKSKHWDATHNVPAYIIREGNICRFSDDGEPQGTAGMPALNVLQKEGLTDCVWSQDISAAYFWAVEGLSEPIRTRRKSQLTRGA